MHIHQRQSGKHIYQRHQMFSVWRIQEFLNLQIHDWHSEWHIQQQVNNTTSARSQMSEAFIAHAKALKSMGLKL